MELSIVVPCYNSAKSIRELITRLNQVLNSLVGNSYEVILVNDCSTDNTLEVLQEVVNDYRNIKVIDLMYNVGQFRTLYCGMEYACGNYIVTMDDDLQHPPEEIPKLYTAIKNNTGIDAVFGLYIDKKHSKTRNIGTFIVSKINTLIYNKPRHLAMSAFRIMTKQLVQTVLSYKTISPVLGAIILKSTTNKIINVQVEHHSRKYGRSNYSTFKLIKTALDNLLNFSSKPLQIISIIGMGVSVLSFIMSVGLAIRYMVKSFTMPGWTSIMILLNFYSGLILICLGLIGEYLIRILMEVNGTPRFKVRNITESKSNAV